MDDPALHVVYEPLRQAIISALVNVDIRRRDEWSILELSIQ
jgi:hypothetical protein